MSYLHDRKKEKNRKIFIIGLVLAIIFIMLSLFGVFLKLGRIFHFFGRPIWQAKDSISNQIDASLYIIRTKKSVFRENENLISENETLKNKMLDYEILEKENIELKELLGRIENPDNYILGRVISKPNKSPYDTIVLDIGKDGDIYNGQKVFATPSIPIGEIVEVYENTSLVKLYSSPDEVTDAEIDVVNTSVELIGRGGGNFEMTVPKDLSVPNGVAVVLPGLSSKILAIVVDTITDAKDPTNKIILKSPLNIQELKWVQILR